jgi:hypothetical protein
MAELYNYYLHFNPYTGYWNAVKREKSVDYLNGKLGMNDVLKYKDINDLIRFISAGKNK